VTMATILVLNGVAVVGLLALLAATMRLPYHLPTSPRSSVAGREDRLRRAEASLASRRSRQERGAPEPVYSR
jgi:hypothetical protein